MISNYKVSSNMSSPSSAPAHVSADSESKPSHAPSAASLSLHHPPPSGAIQPRLLCSFILPAPLVSSLATFPCSLAPPSSLGVPPLSVVLPRLSCPSSVRLHALLPFKAPSTPTRPLSFTVRCVLYFLPPLIIIHHLPHPFLFRGLIPIAFAP